MKKIDRFLVVGCPRSGTTFVQSILASREHALSFRESHYMTSTGFNGKLWRLSAYFAHPWKLRPFYDRVTKENGWQFEIPKPNRSLFRKPTTSNFFLWLDRIAEASGADRWIEKSPEHALYLKSMLSSDENIKILFVHRNPVDNIASLYNAALRYPGSWAWFKKIENCVKGYNRFVRQAEFFLDHPNVLVLSYEKLRDGSEVEFTKLKDFAKMNNHVLGSEILDSDDSLIVRPDEKWKFRESRAGIRKRDQLSDTQIEFIKKNAIELFGDVGN